MKKLLFLSIVLIGICASLTVHAQGVGINSTGNAADASAIIDVSSTTKGALIPRMTTGQRDAITSPANSLQIFNTDVSCLQMYVYGVWQNVWCATCPTPSAPLAGTQNPSQTQIVWNWNTVSGASGYKWNTANNYNTATDNSVYTSNTQTGLACSTSYTLYVWSYNFCGANSLATTLTQSTTGSVPSAPIAAMHTPSSTQIVWNWNTVSGSTGYKYSTLNNYISAIDNGNNTSYTQTGLACNTSYDLYVWAYNDCGNSSVLQLTQTTSICPFVQFNFTGSEQYFNVPSGITTITVKAWGGGGAGGGSSSNIPAKGGGAGFIKADLTVTPGEQLTIIVGGGGQMGSCGGGGGGGRSGVKRGGNEEFTAAGGGGSGAWEGPGGAGGGFTGGDGSGQYPGIGGTTSAGGAGGGGPYAGNAGSAYTGGNTYDNGCGQGGYGGGGRGGYYGGGGGGGAGWFGGGGGGAVSNNAGGGGGSSYSIGSNITTVAGSGTQPGQISDPNYSAPIGVGGNAGNSGNDGRVVITW